ncbi:MAG: rhodanese-like domain-containing protein [Candidatus Omnitrophota bacterium]|jgi:rhodanese-related sulfurtransferase|nr:MAG: rhodanese-like domain-containing protein [Candidatus Omnitrophota bacterium]
MVRKITRDELKGMIESGVRFKLVDVLVKEHFDDEHIKGAISLPLNELEQKASKLLKRDDLIVVYCASFECQASTKAAEKLMSMGYKNVLDYKGGLKDYKEGGMPLEGQRFKREGQSCQACSAC